MPGGVLKYRCRLCGTTYDHLVVPNMTAAMATILIDGATPKRPGAAPLAFGIHHCGPGRVGLADLLGGVAHAVTEAKHETSP